jgi:hypothetical protein
MERGFDRGQGMRLPAVSSAPWLLAALFAPAWLAGCSPTATYGTGQAPELALFREVTGGILSSGKKEPIEYQPRAPLVMPPTATAEQLPPPAETAAAAAADWPLDPDERAAAVPERSEEEMRYGGGQAEYRRLKPLVGVLPEPPQQGSMDDRQPAYDIVHSREQRATFQKALAEAEGYGSNERRYLTDPPTEYRQPASTAPAEFENIDTSGGGGGWFRWLLGG